MKLNFSFLLQQSTVCCDRVLIHKTIEVLCLKVVVFRLLNFYTYTDDDMWFEYEAEFTDGRLIEIRPISIYRNAAGGPPDVFFPPPDRPTAPEDTAPEQDADD